MNKEKNYILEEQDDILKELWEAKDYYSLSCKSSFSCLAEKIRKDIKKISMSRQSEINLEKVST